MSGGQVAPRLDSQGRWSCRSGSSICVGLRILAAGEMAKNCVEYKEKRALLVRTLL